MIKAAKVVFPLLATLLFCLTSCGSPQLIVPTMDNFIKDWNETGEKTGYIHDAAYVEIKQEDIQSSGDTKYFSVKTDNTLYVGAYNSVSRSFALGYAYDSAVTTEQAQTAIRCLAPAICHVPKDTITRLQEEFSTSKTERNDKEEFSVNGFILLVSDNNEAEPEISIKVLGKGEEAVKTAVSLVENAQYMNLPAEAIESKIYEVLNTTKVNPNFAPTIGAMIQKVFYSYDITYEPYQDSLVRYSVTVSGDYCPNPDIQNLSMNGSITYLVDIDNGDCAVFSDPKNIAATFLVFIVN